jgi:hypothetical protein
MNIKASIDFLCSENGALGEKEQLFVSKISDICAAAELSRAASGVCSVYRRRISPCSEFGGRLCRVNIAGDVAFCYQCFAAMRLKRNQFLTDNRQSLSSLLLLSVRSQPALFFVCCRRRTMYYWS